MWSVVFECFFFKQKTAYEMRISDWSSDVCSSDLFRLLVLLIDIEHRIMAEGAVDRRARNARIARNAVIGLHPHAALGVDAQAVGAGEGETGRASCRERVCQ